MFLWDETKNASNRSKHGLGFDAVYDFDWDTVLYADRSRHGDGERRLAAISMLYGKLYTIVFTPRENDIRIISLRRANKTEEKLYAEKEFCVESMP